MKERRSLSLVLTALSWLAALVATPALGRTLAAPLGLQWGVSPEAAHGVLLRSFRDVGGDEPNPDKLLYERRYAGAVLGLAADHVAPLFFGTRLFGVAASFSPQAPQAATAVWEALVERLTRDYGAPQVKTKPYALLSWNAILRLLPPDANRSAIMTLYQAAEKDPDGGRYLLQDLQVQVGLWVPEATWRFDGGAVVKALMRATGSTTAGFTALKPTVLFTSYEQLK